MWVLIVILAIPLIEIGLFVEIGGMIGLWPTLIWVVLAAALGIIVLKGVGGMGPITVSRDLREMDDPLSPLAHRLMVVLAGGLLLLPGFFTDFIGLALLIPPVRMVIIKLISRRVRRVMEERDSQYYGNRPDIIDGEWTAADPKTPGTSPADSTRH
jgi:UPF0716 protein FxsA